MVQTPGFRLLSLALFLIVSLAFFVGCENQKQRDSSASNSAKTAEPKVQEEQIRSMTFDVTIPQNTPEEDTVWVYIGQTPLKMQKVTDFSYRIVLSETQLFGKNKPQKGDKVRYRYSRNGYDFRTAEYLAPNEDEPDRDTNNFFWTKQGREVSYEPGKVQEDLIERWRWFPKEGMIGKTTVLEPSGKFLPRVGGVDFMSGQTIEDLYVPAFHDFFNSTARHLKAEGFTWVELDPPWQWNEPDGLPKVVNDLGNAPNYPDDKTFLEELHAYKKAGLKVIVAPQICCTSIAAKDKPVEWWDDYFNETEGFLVHFARLSQEGDADAFMYAVPSWNEYPAQINVEEKWRHIFKSIRKDFHGQVGEMVWLLGPEVSPTPSPIPDPSYVKWDDQLDFFMVATEFPLSTQDEPTDGQLKEGADRILDGTKVFYNEFHKPVIVRNGYFNVKHSWKGQAFYQIDSVPWISEPENKLQQSRYEFNTEDHARTVNAMFQSASERPWVIGYFHFGYTHWEDPLSPWMSIRAKPAENIWSKWNGVIYNESLN